MKRFSRRSILRLGAFGGLGAGGSAFVYGSAFERKWLIVERQDILLRASIPELAGLRIGVLADFHHDEVSEPELVAHAVELMNRERPDLVMLAGDFVTSDKKAIDELAGLLTGLRAPLGIYAVTGNHDHNAGATAICRTLEKAGIQPLRNAHQCLAINGREFAVAGVDSVSYRKADYRKATRSLDPDTPVILGAHEPDFFLQTANDPRLVVQVSGHTHGGQCRVPYLGALVLPAWGRTFVQGLYSAQGSHVYVTRGVGTTSWKVRFSCPPEISLLTLKAQEAA